MEQLPGRLLRRLRKQRLPIRRRQQQERDGFDARTWWPSLVGLALKPLNTVKPGQGEPWQRCGQHMARFHAGFSANPGVEWRRAPYLYPARLVNRSPSTGEVVGSLHPVPRPRRSRRNQSKEITVATQEMGRHGSGRRGAQVISRFLRRPQQAHRPPPPISPRAIRTSVRRLRSSCSRVENAARGRRTDTITSRGWPSKYSGGRLCSGQSSSHSATFQRPLRGSA